jgi:hypothetical protein
MDNLDTLLDEVMDTLHLNGPRYVRERAVCKAWGACHT